MINEHNNYNFKWVNKIKSIFQNIGRPDIWLNQNHLNLKNVHKLVKQALIDQFKQNWHSELTLSNKGQLYLKIKAMHINSLEPYFKHLNKKETMNIFRYRTANHSLPVETGRYENIPYQDRICPLCQTDAVGTEIHYLLYCPFFNTDRDRLLLSNFNTISPNTPLSTLLSSENVSLLKAVSKLASRIMTKFKK